MTSPYLVPVASLLRHVGTSRDVAFTVTFDPTGALAATTAGGSEVLAGADVDVRLTLTSHLGGVTARGVAIAPWHAMCRRCCAEASGVLEASIDERFRPGASPDDEDDYPLEGEVVDLEPMVRDAIVLGLPLAPLCRPDCAGLCPTCGEDRNAVECSCQPVTDPRWATLDALRVPHRAPGRS